MVIKILDPGSGSTSKLFKYFNPKIVSKLLEVSSGMFIPDPDLDFLPILNPWSRIQGSKRPQIPDPQHRKTTVLIAYLWWIGVYCSFFRYSRWAGRRLGKIVTNCLIKLALELEQDCSFSILIARYWTGILLIYYNPNKKNHRPPPLSLTPPPPPHSFFFASMLTKPAPFSPQRSGSRIRCFFDPWIRIRDPRWEINLDPGGPGWKSRTGIILRA